MRNRYKRDVNRLIQHPRRIPSSRSLRNPGGLNAVYSSGFGLIRKPPEYYKRVTLACGVDHFACVLDNEELFVSGYYDSYGVMSDKPSGTGFSAVASGDFGSIAMKYDGTVVAWGDTDYSGGLTGTPGAAIYGIRDVPPGLVANNIAMSLQCAAAITDDGQIVVWGADNEGEVSGAPPGTGWKTIMGADFNFIAVHEDGTVATWGFVPNGENITPPPEAVDCVFASVADGRFWAIRSDQTFVSWGYTTNPGDPAMPDPVWIRAGTTAANGLAIDRNGVLEGFGIDGGAGVPSITDAAIADVMANLQMAVKKDGTFVWWGDTSDLNAPPTKVQSPSFGWL